MNPLTLFSALALLFLAGATAAQETRTTYGDAMRWYQRAAETGSADAQFLLGQLFEAGVGRPQDPAAAAAWYRKAAVQGHRLAQYKLGLMYFAANGVPRDVAKAAEWYRKAAQQGLAEAQFNLGNLHDRGTGVAASRDQAALWYRKAALQGSTRAQFNLGLLLAGIGGAKFEAADPVEAWVWLSLAAETGEGEGDAAAARDEVAKGLSAAEKEDARERLGVRRKEAGAKVGKSVTKKTDFVVLGANPGSKAAKAEKLGTPTIDVEAYRAVLERGLEALPEPTPDA